MLRYRSEGEVHKDFHGLTCATLHYLMDNYGEDAVREVLSNTAEKVYKTIHNALCEGDCSELSEFWEYYMKRECAGFTIERLEGGVKMTVCDCPAQRHLLKLGRKADPVLCKATRIFNEALVKGSLFSAELREAGPYSCIQIIKRRDGAHDTE